VVVLNATGIVTTDLNQSQIVIFSAIAVISGVLFEPLRRFVTYLIHTFITHESYSTESLIDELNKALVSNSDTEVLLSKSCALIERRMNAEFVSFFVRNTSYFEGRMVGDYGAVILDAKELDTLHTLLPKTHKKLFAVQNSSYRPGSEETDIMSIMRKNNVEILIRIVSTLEYEVDGVGYLMLGAKKDGRGYTDQELRLLEIIGNELEIAVENSLKFEEIEQFNVTLQKKIDDATRELTKSNEKLMALDKAKDEFVSMASHQLRTPLTSIKGYISMVLEGDAGDVNETQKQMLGQALFSSQRMVYLISDLLNVSRLRTGKFIIEPKQVYLPDLVESEVEQLIEGAKAKNITLSYVKPRRCATLMLDDMKIRQVVMNFIDNAIYYTPNGGKITVNLKQTEHSVEFKVKDTGIGVPKDQIHKLFTKFYRADNARKARPDGTGIGLFMAKKVVVAQKGSIIVESVEGEGSTFGFSFPLKELEAPTK